MAITVEFSFNPDIDKDLVGTASAAFMDGLNQVGGISQRIDSDNRGDREKFYAMVDDALAKITKDAETKVDVADTLATEYGAKK